MRFGVRDAPAFKESFVHRSLALSLLTLIVSLLVSTVGTTAHAAGAEFDPRKSESHGDPKRQEELISRYRIEIEVMRKQRLVTSLRLAGIEQSDISSALQCVPEGSEEFRQLEDAFRRVVHPRSEEGVRAVENLKQVLARIRAEHASPRRSWREVFAHETGMVDFLTGYTQYGTFFDGLNLQDRVRTEERLLWLIFTAAAAGPDSNLRAARDVAQFLLETEVRAAPEPGTTRDVIVRAVRRCPLSLQSYLWEMIELPVANLLQISQERETQDPENEPLRQAMHILRSEL